jgi:FkbM family methyltransferase
VPKKMDKLNNCKWLKLFPIGLWNSNGRANLNIPRNEDLDDCSSFLEFGNEGFIKGIYEKTESKIDYDKVNVERKRFDSLDIDIKSPCLLKIDTEGSEIFVLKGFGSKLKEIDVIQLEVNFQENQKGQTKISELISYLELYGFIGFIQKTLRYGENGYPNHCDLIFFRKN